MGDTDSSIKPPYPTAKQLLRMRAEGSPRYISASGNVWRAWDLDARRRGVSITRSALIRIAIVHEAIRRGLVDGQGVDLGWFEIVPEGIPAISPGERLESHRVRLSDELFSLVHALAGIEGVSPAQLIGSLSLRRYGANRPTPRRRGRPPRSRNLYHCADTAQAPPSLVDHRALSGV